MAPSFVIPAASPCSSRLAQGPRRRRAGAGLVGSSSRAWSQLLWALPGPSSDWVDPGVGSARPWLPPLSSKWPRGCWQQGSAPCSSARALRSRPPPVRGGVRRPRWGIFGPREAPGAAGPGRRALPRTKAAPAGPRGLSRSCAAQHGLATWLPLPARQRPRRGPTGAAPRPCCPR